MFANLFKWLFIGKLCLPQKGSRTAGYADKFGK